MGLRLIEMAESVLHLTLTSLYSFSTKIDTTFLMHEMVFPIT
jgi:hypothetical protein